MIPARTVSRRLASIAFVAVLGLGSCPQAQAADNAQLERRLDESLRRIDALASRVEQLEQQLAAAKATAPANGQPAASSPSAAVASSAVATSARLDEVERTVNQLTASSGHDLREPGLPLHGFADVGFVRSRNAATQQHDGFAVGSLDFYLTPEFGANVKTLVELNFGVSSSGGTQADLERAQIGYAFSDALTIWLGRFHTPFGYWNMAFHHGAQIQPSILRPRMLDFEDDGGILPIHTTGAWATGGVRLGSDKLIYNAYVGNGTRVVDGQLNPNPGGDDNGNKAVGFGLNYRFGGSLDGLTLGVSGLRQTVGAYDKTGALESRTRLTLLGGHAAYDNEGWELIGEYYRLHDVDLSAGSGGHGSWTGYVHIGHTILDRWVPYYRIEKAALDQTDNYFLSQANGRSYLRHVLGLRYNADQRAAVKLEFGRTDDRGLGHPTDQLRLQYAVGF
jgi:hypothetical protein